MKAVRRLSVLALVLAALVLSAAPAHATTFDDVGAALRQNALYVDPQAEVQLSSSEQSQVTSAIKAAGTPIYIAVLPKAALTSAGGNPNTVLDKMAQAVGRPGTYAVMIGASNSSYGFQARSTLGTVGDLANNAYVQNQGDPTATLVQFSNSVGELAAAGGLAGKGTSESAEPDSGTPAVLLAVVGLLGVAGLGGIWYVSRKKKKALAVETATVRKTLDEDITAYGEALDSFNPDLSDPRLGDEGRADLQAALDRYDQAKYAADAMASPDDAANVTAALDEGRWYVARVQARLDGAALPDRRPPCFFDPRHGQSVTDVPFAPGGGAVRDVPACQACSVAVASGALPDLRMVESGGAMRPYWDSGPQYAGYTGGYYRSNMDLFSTIFMATMIGSMFSHVGYGGGYADGGWGGGGSDSGWGGGGESGGWFDGGGGGGWGGGGGGDFGGGGW